MNFVQSIKTCFRKYFDFRGRATRSEFWWFQLFYLCSTILLGIVDVRIFGAGVEVPVDPLMLPEKISLVSIFWDEYHISNAFYYLTLIPMLSVAVRRFHDIGLSGVRALGWLLLPVVMGFLMGIVITSKGGVGFYAILLSFFIIVAIYIYWLTRKSDPNENRFGPSQNLDGLKNTFN